ncbi:MAG: TetR/AcrR family transcriptional regulator [Erysipelotrichaceae bacterium]
MNNEQKNTYVKQQLSQALLTLLKTQSLDKITITQLIQEAEVSRVSFYRNFVDKEAIIHQYDAQLIKAWGKAFEANPNSSIDTLWLDLFTHYKTHQAFYLLLYRNGLSSVMLKTIEDHIDISHTSEPAALYGKHFIAHGLYGILCCWMQRNMEESPEALHAFFAQQNK